ncbi:DUF6634 family protein [Palleronia sp.]|uniref:DUF6634 family protein n=1 Tax=Palleronia sp. TaxID=1940284 RepID=UPI0035C81961
MLQYVTARALLSAIAEAEAGPQPGELDDAPAINNWFLIWRDGDVVRADGDVSGHPTISDPWVTTSPVLGYAYDFDRQRGWLRSISRWYRLGQLRKVPVDATVPDQARREALLSADIRLERQRREWRDQYRVGT